MKPKDAHHADSVNQVSCAILTISDSRTLDTDMSGTFIRDRLKTAGHHVVSYEIIPDDAAQVRDRVLSICEDQRIHVVLLAGGTGLAARDTTYEAVATILKKRLDGFGELFRALSYEEIGSAAMLSRAVAGVRNRTVVFSMPGSRAAVRLAMEKLILPQLGHIAGLLGH